MWYGPTEGRRLSLSDKKPRGIRRRLRWLEAWARRAADRFPDEEWMTQESYVHTKIPVLSNLVEGHHAKRRAQTACAQALIDACAGLIAAKPSQRAAWRVTCGISLPDMFSSELCIYIDEDYFRSSTGVGDAAAIISGRSLADEWGLRLPRGVLEIGRTWKFDDGDASFAAEYWHFGEVGLRV